jgi:hypothetical protein
VVCAGGGGAFTLTKNAVTKYCRAQDSLQQQQMNTNKHVLERECKAQRNVNEPVRSAGSNPACTTNALPDGETILRAGQSQL